MSVLFLALCVLPGLLAGLVCGWTEGLYLSWRLDFSYWGWPLIKKGVSALVGGWSSDCWYIVSGPAGGILCQRSDFGGVNGSGGLEALSQVVAWGSGSGHDPWWGRGLLQEFYLCHGQLSIWKGHLVWEVKLTLSWQEGINKSLANPKGEKVWSLGKWVGPEFCSVLLEPECNMAGTSQPL